MNNRELLKLAAKASGELPPSWYGNDAYFDGVLSRWNPLADDGDALRLAVKLGLAVYHWADEICVFNGNGTINVDIARTGDVYAATRRAIVIAAAEIGRSME